MPMFSPFHCANRFFTIKTEPFFGHRFTVQREREDHLWSFLRQGTQNSQPCLRLRRKVGTKYFSGSGRGGKILSGSERVQSLKPDSRNEKIAHFFARLNIFTLLNIFPTSWKGGGTLGVESSPVGNG